MVKQIAFFLFLILSNLALSQISATVINEETKAGIPFVNIWVENQNRGVTSNTQGEFVINASESATLVFSAIGFETTYFSADSIDELVTMKPVVNQLDEIVLRPKIGDKKLKIGSFKRGKINHYFACGLKPWISARFFKYDSIVEQTIFLKKISILTDSNIKNSQFNLRLYGINENGAPEGYIYDQNIIVTAKKGKRVTKVDLTELNIQFPESGFFVAVEWLIIADNKHDNEYQMKGSKNKDSFVTYEPSIGTIPTENDENSWVFMNGRWSKVWKVFSISNKKNENNKYNLLAIELTLTN
jgi:hypothetical protein